MRKSSQRRMSALGWGSLLIACTFGALTACGGDQEFCDSDLDCLNGTSCDPVTNLCVSTPAFVLRASPANLKVAQGKSGSLTLSTTRKGGFAEEVTLELEGAPAGVTISSLVLTPSNAEGAVTVSTSANTPVGSATLKIKGVSASATDTVEVGLEVAPASELLVDITSPSADAATNGTIVLQVVVEGGTADKVELLKDGALLAVLTPPYQYAWNTTSEAEGAYAISVRAVLAGKTYAGPVRTITVDRTAPVLVERTPVDGARDVAVSANIQATFNEAIDPATVTDATVNVSTAGANVAKSLALSSDRRTLTIALTATPSTPSTYGVTFSGVRDAAGNTLATGAWGFTYPSWVRLGTPLSANPGGTGAERAKIELDSNGRPVVAWIESDGSDKHVYVARWTGTAWQQLGSKLEGSTMTGSSVDDLDLKLDDSGNPVVAFCERDPRYTDTPGDVNVTRWNGTAWSPYPRVAISTCSQIALTLDASGAPWFLTRGWNPDYNAYAWSGSAWKQMGNVHNAFSSIPNYFNPFCVEMARSPAGAIHIAVCPGQENGTAIERGIGVAQWNGTSWQMVGPMLMAPKKSAVEVELAFDSAGAPVVVFQDGYDPSTAGVYSTKWSGTSWSTAAKVNTNGPAANNPALAIRGSHVKAAWTGNFTGSGRSVGVSNGASGWTQVGTPLDSDGSSATQVGRPSLALDGAGRPFLAFDEGTGVPDIHVFRPND